MRQQLRLRVLRAAERRVLRTKLRTRTLSVRLHQRYRIIAEVRQGRSAAEVAERVLCALVTVYHWVRRFNASGFATFERPTNPKGREPIVRGEQLRALVDVALSSPLERGLPFATWSVASLTAYCKARRLLPDITDEWVRRLLRREGLTPQRMRTWKTSHDPAFERKKTAFAASIGAAHRARRSSASTSGGRWN
jgi:transposase